MSQVEEKPEDLTPGMLARPVLHFEDYCITPNGHVLTCFQRGGDGRKTINWRPLTPVKNKAGDLIVCLHRDRKQFMRRICVLMLTTFVRLPPSDEHEPWYIDGDKSNIQLSNLRWEDNPVKYIDFIDRCKRDELFAQRFWSKVAKASVIECWPWMGNVTHDGYGMFKVGGRKGRNYLAHRIAYELTVGPIPDELNICHQCDNPPCCNGYHGTPGTQKQNMQDAMSKGRWSPSLPGESNPRSKLRAADIPLIRGRHANGATVKEIADDYGMSLSAIADAISGAHWGGSHA